jgi:hypothetical protein
VSVDEYGLLARQIANFTNNAMSSGFDPQQALQEAVEQLGELQTGWDVDFASHVYSYTWEAWDAGLLAYTTVRDAIVKADG